MKRIVFCLFGFVMVFGVCTGAMAAPVTFSNPTPIIFPQTDPFAGFATPFPSAINVSGLTGTITDVNVSIYGLSHEYPEDIVLMLQGPTGGLLYLMAYDGADIGVTDIDITFDDEAADFLGVPLTSGSYLPTGTLLSLPPPTPPFALSMFDGQDPNGIWNLFAFDTTFWDTGAIDLGWQIEIDTTGDPVPAPSAVLLLSTGFVGLICFSRRAKGI